MKRTIITVLLTVLMLTLFPVLSQPASATELTEISKGVEIIANAPAIGMDINDLTAQVYKAQLESIRVYDAYTEEEITEGCFEKGVVYLIRYALTPRDGEKFAEWVGVTCNGYHMTTAESDTRLVYQKVFNTCAILDDTKITVPLLRAGMKTEEIVLSIPEDAKYTIRNFKIIDLQDNVEAEYLKSDQQYKMQFTLMPNKGYALNSVFDIYCNSVEMGVSLKNACTYAECSLNFSLDVGEISFTWTTVRMNEGEVLRAPFVSVSRTERVKAYDVRMLDSQKNPATGNVVGGETYYLAFDICTIGPVGPWEMPNIVAISNFTVDVIDETHATVYVPFVGLHPLGQVQVFYQGFEEGQPVSNVTVQVEGNATVSYYIQDQFNKTVKDGVFESGTIYSLKLSVKPHDGYFIPYSPSLEVNGKTYTFSGSYTSSIFASFKLDTRYIIDTAKVKISGVGVGKTISKVKITPASGSKFDIWEENWAATDTSSTKFKKGELYQVRVVLDSDTAYRFTEDTVFTIGGKKAFDVAVNGDGDRLYGTIQFSYRTKISKVTLPAMPKSVKLGATLPTKFKVSSSAKYTLESVWMKMSTQETVTTADQNDCYVLTYVAVPKDGCEFTEDTVFYVGGKKVEPILVTNYFAEIMKPYNVGLTKVDRIDLTIPAPEHGIAPGEVTVATDAPYVALEQAWGVNTSGKLKDGAETVTVFENYKYHFLAVEFQTKSGYIFADKVSVYINGNKYAVLEEYNLGAAYQMTVCFGKLGEIAKLTAPELSKDGLTLDWSGVPNADAYEVYRATSKRGKYTKVATVAETTWTDSPTTGKTYYYKVKATFTPDTTKNSGYSAVVSIAYKCDAPVITVNNDETGKPVISWEKVSGAKKYEVYYSTNGGTTFKKLTTTKKLSYTHTKAAVGTEYIYRVRAVGSKKAYNSLWSENVSITAICAQPSITAKVDTTTGKPVISWKKITGATGYAIYRNGEELTTVTGTSYKDSDVQAGSRYSYKVIALGKSEEFNGAASAEKTVTATCAAPKLTGKAGSTGKPELSWGEVEEATGYAIYRSTKKSKGYKLIEETEDLTFTDTTAKKGKTYYYKVVAIGDGCESAQSGCAKVKSKK